MQPLTSRLNLPALAALACLAALVWLANWLIVSVGPVPVGFGLYAPAGVYAAAFVLVARDALHELGGRRWVAAGVLVGAALSAFLSGLLALASGAAFLVSELADWLVYSRVRARGAPLAVLASGGVGLVVDSVLFLALAFGSLAFLPGQLVGKGAATLFAAGAVWLWTKQRRGRLWAA